MGSIGDLHETPGPGQVIHVPIRLTDALPGSEPDVLRASRSGLLITDAALQPQQAVKILLAASRFQVLSQVSQAVAIDPSCPR